MPNTVQAKTSIPYLFDQKYQLTEIYKMYFGGSMVVVVAVLALMVVALGNKRAWPIALWLIAYNAAMMGRAHYRWWYYVPVVMAIYVAAAIGAARLLSLTRRWQSRVLAMAIAVAVAVSVAWTNVSHALWLKDLPQGNRKPLEQIAEEVNCRCQVGDSVLIYEVGVIGYYAGDRVRVHDMFGLVSPELVPILSTRRKITDRWKSVIRQTRPRYISYSPRGCDAFIGEMGYSVVHEYHCWRYRLWKRKEIASRALAPS